MRNIATAFIAAAFLAWSAPAAAQNFGFGAHAGVSLPTADYSGAADVGFSGGLDLLLPLGFVPPSVTWYTSVDAVGHSAAHEGIDGGFLHVPLLTGARLDLGMFGPIRPFATGQLGAAFSNGPDTPNDPGTETVFAWAIGGGLDLTENIYAGAKWFNLNDVNYGGAEEVGTRSPSFVDIYVGFGVR